MLNQALSVPLLPGAAAHLLSLLFCLPRQRERLPGCSARSSGSLTVVTLDWVRSRRRRPSLNLSADGISVEISKCVQVCRGRETEDFWSPEEAEEILEEVIQSSSGGCKEPHRTLESPLDHCDPISNKQFEKAPLSGRASSLSCLCLLRLHWHGAADKRARPRSVGPMMDFSCDETGKGPPVQMHSLREFEQLPSSYRCTTYSFLTNQSPECRETRPHAHSRPTGDEGMSHTLMQTRSADGRLGGNLNTGLVLKDEENWAGNPVSELTSEKPHMVSEMDYRFQSGSNGAFSGFQGDQNKA
ncbi:hypothetical protein CRENBAI_011373 [Crenichthys baileyi]|uniref:Uncharacterized protein n=1 Tax=Crenichthys baileyi TaxID=28760 RepID=A0AAV9SES2_9TELE